MASELKWKKTNINHSCERVTVGEVEPTRSTSFGDHFVALENSFLIIRKKDFSGQQKIFFSSLISQRALKGGRGRKEKH